MDWTGVINNPYLRNLPFKIELNKWGKIVMSPASNHHGILQSEAGFYLRNKLPNGQVIIECSINTADGVKVADVAWASDAFMRRNTETTPYEEAPEICIEIISPSNSREEMNEKAKLYFEKGAAEVWICQDDGAVTHYDDSGQIPQSFLTGEAVSLKYKQYKK